MGDRVSADERGGGAADDRTRLAGTPSSPSSPSSSGWLGSSGSVDYGRFAPGEIIEGRYRVIGLLGRGGMGEVYRADDMRLSQPVALKFLPEALSHDSVRLAQFHNEVRTARQVSHPNVCRVYDIGDASGHLFLSMEYVDGEDLSSLLRRIGRLPEDKALEIARQICAGVAAAHERGVIHRDLKPANIMLDGAGRIRVMDFSLAAVGAVTEGVAGTPAYMAPEQLEGREATIKSDIYALGLVFYELFTGRRAFDAKTLADLVAQHTSGSITAPTELVKALDGTIERAILRCLEGDPARRPASALAVAASLPGGDPLAAALAAGETPSPEMVAAVGGESAMVSPVAGAAWLASVAILLLVVAALSDRTSLLARIPLSKPVAVLLDRAEGIRQSLGYTDTPVDQASGLEYDHAYLNWADKHGSADGRWRELSQGRPAVLLFWYRTSPARLVPRNPLGTVDWDDPPVTIAGTTVMTIDTKGRLVSFAAVPPQIDSSPPTSGATDWRPIFAAAQLDQSAFTETTPERTPLTFADERRAWKGTLPDTGTPVTIEAAAYHARPVSFEIVAPWTSAARQPEPSASSRESIQTAIILVVLAIAVVLARRNIRSGRADRRGASRLGIFIFFIYIATWAALPHVTTLPEETQRFYTWIGIGLFVAGVMYLIYLAIEPFVRRSWPTMLVGWSRALMGRGRDALVGRDLLVGLTGGLVLALITRIHEMAPRFLGWPEGIPLMPWASVLEHSRYFGLAIANALNNGLQNALISVMMFTVLREIVRRTAARVGLRQTWTDYLAAIVVLAAMTSIGVVNNDSDRAHLGLALLYQFTFIVTFLGVLLRYGLLATVVTFTANAIADRMPLTLNSASLYAGPAWLVIGLLFAVAALGLWMARGGERMFGSGPFAETR
jgi:serine/threonine-protein kinase